MEPNKECDKPEETVHDLKPITLVKSKPDQDDAHTETFNEKELDTDIAELTEEIKRGKELYANLEHPEEFKLVPNISEENVSKLYEYIKTFDRDKVINFFNDVGNKTIETTKQFTEKHSYTSMSEETVKRRKEFVRNKIHHLEIIRDNKLKLKEIISK